MQDTRSRVPIADNRPIGPRTKRATSIGVSSQSTMLRRVDGLLLSVLLKVYGQDHKQRL